MSPAPLDRRFEKTQISVENLTDRVNDIYLRQVELEKRVEELEIQLERAGEAEAAKPG